MRPSDDSDPLAHASSDELRARLARLEVLHRVNQIIHSTLELRESLELILREAIAIVRGDSGLVALANPTTGFLEIEAAQGLPAATRSLRLRLGEGLAGRVARTGRALLVADITREPNMVRFGSDVGSELAVPLRVADEVRGVIAIQARRSHAFNDLQLALLEELAALASPAVRNTWLYEQARLKARFLESLVRVGQIINSTLSLDEALHVITREAGHLLHAKMCSLMMLDDSETWLDLRASHGAGPRYCSKPRLSVAESFAGIVVRRRKPMQIENVQVAGHYQNSNLAREEGLVSLLSVPLTYGGKATGTLNLYTGEPHTFSDEEVRVLSAYAELSALALEKARLYDRTVAVEEQLRESERLTSLGLLAAELAHEIRNPLTVMKMLHHSVSSDFPAEDPRATDLRVMGEKMDHLNRIVDRVLDLARRNEPQLTPVDVNELLDDLGLLTRYKCRAQNVELLRQGNPNVPTLLGDPTLLEQAFLNLTLNGLEAMPEGGRFFIRTRTLPLAAAGRLPTHVLVRFRDTGAGMPEEQRSRAFSSLLSSTKPKGTGLGLALVARVVEAHEGQIRIWSRPGRGTAISMILPIRS
ncbi:MAG TPA: GAF domain-containing protein [Verrucomicrobiota bacterium]|nr:GAF domain-containing protein [Verrucomicrobiota bacterium]